jgi:hypothetical protein
MSRVTIVQVSASRSLASPFQPQCTRRRRCDWACAANGSPGVNDGAIPSMRSSSGGRPTICARHRVGDPDPGRPSSASSRLRCRGQPAESPFNRRNRHRRADPALRSKRHQRSGEASRNLRSFCWRRLASGRLNVRWASQKCARALEAVYMASESQRGSRARADADGRWPVTSPANPGTGDGWMGVQAERS